MESNVVLGLWLLDVELKRFGAWSQLRTKETSEVLDKHRVGSDQVESA